MPRSPSCEFECLFRPVVKFYRVENRRRRFQQVLRARKLRPRSSVRVRANRIRGIELDRQTEKRKKGKKVPNRTCSYDKKIQRDEREKRKEKKRAKEMSVESWSLHLGEILDDFTLSFRARSLIDSFDRWKPLSNLPFYRWTNIRMNSALWISLDPCLTNCADNWLRTVTSDRTAYNNSSLPFWTRYHWIENYWEAINLLLVSSGLYLNILETEGISQFWDKKFSTCVARYFSWLRTLTSDRTAYNNSSLPFWTRYHWIESYWEAINLLFVSPGLYLNILKIERILREFWDKKVSRRACHVIPAQVEFLSKKHSRNRPISMKLGTSIVLKKIFDISSWIFDGGWRRPGVA